MVDGVVDAFEDETGVDGVASSGQTYDAASDWYHNPGGYTADLIPTMTGYAAPAGTVTESGTAGGYEGWEAMDKTASNPSSWSSAFGSSGWLAYEFTSGKVLTQYAIMAG